MMQNARTDQFIGAITQELNRPAVDVEELALRPQGNIGVRRLLVEVAIAVLALDKPSLDSQPLELDSRACGKDPEDEQPARLGRHRPFVKHRHMAADDSFSVPERHTDNELPPQPG